MSEEINKDVGRIIHRVRQERGLTQIEFARRLRTSQSAVNRIEHGNQNLSLKTLQRISDVLNYHIVTLNEVDKPKVEVVENPEVDKLVITVSRRS